MADFTTARIWSRVTGAGPAVVVPRLNIDWTEVELDALEERFTVVVVSPRGFGLSERPGRYVGAEFVADIQGVVDQLGFETYATFGYSMNGAMAARLAVDEPRVSAVVCGGLPLTADLTRMGARSRRRHADAQQDAVAWTEVTDAYDPEAAVAFWDDIGCLPRYALADVSCPARCWWGEFDAVSSSLADPVSVASDLTSRGITYDILPDLDHDGALDQLDLILPTLAEWLSTIE